MLAGIDNGGFATDPPAQKEACVSSNQVDVRKVLADVERQNSLRAMSGENDLTSVALREALGAVEQLFTDVRAALEMLERDGKGDSPLAGFLRAALARAGGAA